MRRIPLYGALLLGLVVAFFRLQGIGVVTGATRAVNKRIGNPAMMKLAGRRYFFAGVTASTGVGLTPAAAWSTLRSLNSGLVDSELVCFG